MTSITYNSLGSLTGDQIEKRPPSGMGSFTYVDISSVDREKKQIVSPSIIPVSKAPSRARQVLKAGDVLVSMTRPNLNAVAIVPAELDGSIGSTGFHVLRAKTAEPRFLYYAVQTTAFIDAMCQKVQGALYPAVRPKDISSFILPPFSLSQQRLIVAEIEKQFSRLDEGVAALKRAQANLARYRAAVLKAACEGKLVPTEAELQKAAGKDQTGFEAGEQLLKRILAERRKYWQGRGKYKEPVAPNADDRSPLPDGWTWVSLEQLATHITDGTHKTPTYVEEGVSFLSAKDISGFRLSFDNCRHIPQSEHEDLSKRCTVRRGNVLITKSGTIGRVAVVETDEEFSLFESVANIPVLAPIEPKFVAIAAFVCISGVFGAANQKGVAVRHLHLEDLRRVPIPLPPLAEQKRIVAEVERRLSVIDELEAVASRNLHRADRLRQAVLQKAFKGELG